MRLLRLLQGPQIGGTRLAALAVCAGAIVACWSADGAAEPRHGRSTTAIQFPFEFPGGQYEPLTFGDIPGWAEDDHVAALRTFQTSCKSIGPQNGPPSDPKALGTSLREPCHAARAERIEDGAGARAFFERHFAPVRISKLGESDGFVTGYYEPVVDGSRTASDVYTVPVYRRPGNLFVRGFRQSNASLPNRGQVFRKVGRRKLVPYFDRGEIEDGALAERRLEIVWLKSQTDLLFIQIQGSARVRLEDGATVRINYDSHNGYPYTPVGRVLIERGIVPREEMSMQRIRQWMEDNPEGAKELRRQNRSYVFFREVPLTDKDEPAGAQGVPLTAGRSLAVDKALHVYGTPLFVEGQLPIDGDQAATPFRRLMVAQDTGSAIVGPARGDIYFGAGTEAGRVAGRLRHPVRFVMLVPKALDPLAAAQTLPVPSSRPSQLFAKLFPQTAPTGSAAGETPGKDIPKDEKIAVADPSAKAVEVPLPPPRPDLPPQGAHHRPHHDWQGPT